MLVVGRKVVALLGHTGTGKSTFIHLVAGRRLRKDQQRGYIADDLLDVFVISGAQSSETTTLRPYVRSDGEVVHLDKPRF